MPITPVSVFADDDIYTRYRATLVFLDKVYGGVPRDEKAISAWVRKKLKDEGKDAWVTEDEVRFYVKQAMEDAAMARVITGKTLAELAPEDQMVAMSEEYAEEKHTNGFKRDPGTGKPIIGNFQIRAMLKEAVAIAFNWDDGHKWKRKSPKALFVEYVAVEPLNIILADRVTDVDLCIGHIKGKYGRLSMMTYVEYCERPTITFDVLVLDNALEEFAGPKVWPRLWKYAEKNGLGARRSMGAGRFVVTQWEKVGTDSGPVLQSQNGLVKELAAIG